MTLSSIRLELARDHDFPEGSARHGYELVAPLDAEGHLDAAWRGLRSRCRVRRFWAGADDEIGHLTHHGNGWAFHYDIAGDPATDEPGWRLGSHVFRVGEYVSIREQDGTLRTFRVAAVRAAPPAP
jgi:hypothetical protein